jgi:hypothetical protein
MRWRHGCHRQYLGMLPMTASHACPGYVATNLNGFQGTSTPREGAAIAIKLATLPDDGPTGGPVRRRRGSALVTGLPSAPAEGFWLPHHQTRQYLTWLLTGLHAQDVTYYGRPLRRTSRHACHMVSR